MAEDAADRMVARAIESVLDQVPGSIDSAVPEAGTAKLQPWAETAAPVGRNKRPLEELLVELGERVTADPDARATLPSARHPAIAFFDRFGRGGRGQPSSDTAPAGAEPGGRRRRRRRGGGGVGGQAPAGAAAAQPGGTAERSPSSGRRRRRGRGGGGGGAGGAPGGSSAPLGGQPNQQRPSGAGGRRRRGRRGRGAGGAPPAPAG
ncbi:MAG TPA: hypothetical protein VH498_01555 [Candidatus Dormibacteraeota bacterium]|jgi:hypothetical protein|nr:hypothetical protein [Candidatus Dormibacteraeota bacterium]